MRVSQKRVLVASWPFMQNCCYCYIFDPRFRPDNVKGFFRAIFLSHDKRLLVKEKNARTSREAHIERFFDPRAVTLSVTHSHTLNLTTVTCLENPAKAGIIIIVPQLVFLHRSVVLSCTITGYRMVPFGAF